MAQITDKTNDEQNINNETSKQSNSKTKFVNHKIENVEITEMKDSKYVVPKRMKFTQNGKRRTWDLVESMDAVACLLYHKEMKSFLFVKQFRAPVYYKRMKDGTLNNKNKNDNDKGHQVGCTIECCAGLIDNEKYSAIETMQKEIMEEVGYDVPIKNIELITKYRSAVGILGYEVTMYLAQIDEAMRKGDGGGSIEENELIELVYVPVSESLKYIQKYDDLPPGLKMSLYWFFLNHPELCK